VEARMNKNFTTNDEFMMNEVIKPKHPEPKNLLITKTSSD